MKSIDKFLNSFTMYRVVLSALLLLVVIASLCGFFGVLSFGGFSILLSALLLLLLSWGANSLFAKITGAAPNTESAFITGLILFFILSPAGTPLEFGILALAAILANLSKYLFVIGKKHIINPAAFSAVVLSIAGISLANWWVGTPWLLVPTLLLGLLTARKIRRLSLYGIFLCFAFLSIFITFGGSIPTTELFSQVILSWPIFFFAGFMLTEPLTAPTTKKSQLIFGALVGILFGAQFSFGPVFSNPQLALVLGNIYAHFASRAKRIRLTLIQSKALADNVYEFSFATKSPLSFRAGQYMEWTLPHAHPDLRGNRRYFTIASSPTEKEILLGVRISAEKSSSFKTALRALPAGSVLWASHVSGDFILPKEKEKKLVFIAGGIGITPFRSMAKYLIDTNEKRDIVLFHACMRANDFTYEDVFKNAAHSGIKTICLLTEQKNAPAGWNGKTGYLSREIIESEVPDWKERIFYLSGPEGMVNSYTHLLHEMGVSHRNIKTDYFPGF
jgi:ferredoxin-NADP reductase/Na+-translocating ferredoxin:NAD+ oxidoreductase RnfD subunit